MTIEPDNTLIQGGRTIAVVGSTAVGKSALAVRIARELGGEVVNADSMQLYAGMDIGTAKVTTREQQGIAHHLLDVWPVTRAASVAQYQSMAREVIAAIHMRGRVAVLVGGSGLYVRATLDDIEFPGTDPELRTQLEAELEAVGSRTLHDRLATKDPAAAAAIPPENGRRIVRALEVVELRGSFSATLPGYRYVIPAEQIGLRPPRPVLDERIEARVHRMFADGLVGEVEGLLAVGLREGVTASRALGYAQVIEALDGSLTEQQALDRTVVATRRFARRQESWFGRDSRITWLESERPDEAATHAMALLGA